MKEKREEMNENEREMEESEKWYDVEDKMSQKTKMSIDFIWMLVYFIF